MILRKKRTIYSSNSFRTLKGEVKNFKRQGQRKTAPICAKKQVQKKRLLVRKTGGGFIDGQPRKLAEKGRSY